MTTTLAQSRFSPVIPIVTEARLQGATSWAHSRSGTPRTIDATHLQLTDNAGADLAAATLGSLYRTDSFGHLALSPNLRTNICLQSANIPASPWSTPGATAPSGRLTEDTSTGQHSLRQDVAVKLGTYYCARVWVDGADQTRDLAIASGAAGFASSKFAAWRADGTAPEGSAPYFGPSQPGAVIRQYWAVFQGEANANGSIQVKLSTNLGTGISYTGNGAGGAKILGVEIMPGIISPTGIFIPTGAAPITQRDYSSSATWTDSRGNVAPVYPLTDLVCWGDSLTAAAYPSKLSAKYTPARTTLNGGIGGETSSQILARVKGHDYNGGTGITWTPGTIRLKTARALPPRLIDETYRASWTTYAAAIAEPSYVEWFNDGALIGSSSNQLKAVCTVSTTRFSATGHPFANGDVVYFLGTIVTGMYAGKPYYVRDADATGFSVSEYSGTAAISFGSGTVTALGAFYFDWTYAGGTHNITTLTHTNFDTSTLVLWCGANNVDSIAQVQTDITAAFNHAKTQTKGVLILTVIPSNAWSAGSLANMQTINAWILATYPNNSADVYSYLLTKGNGGTQDNTDISAGLTPSSIRVDAIHLTDAGYGYVADFVAAALATKQWSDPTITLAQSGGTYDGSWSYNGGIEGGDFMEVKW